MIQKKVLVLLAPGFEEIEAITIIDLLRRANIEVITAGLAYKQVNGSHDIRIVANTVLAELNNDIFDAIILPGGQPGTMHLGDDTGVIACVQSHFNAGKWCAAICAAPTIFAKAGIIDGKTITSYPGAINQRNAPTSHYSEAPVVVDGNIITSRGVATAIPFSLKLVELLLDKETSDDLADKILYSRH